MKHKLFTRALWWKEYRQTRVLLWLMMLAGSLTIVYPHMKLLWFYTHKWATEDLIHHVKSNPESTYLFGDYGGALLLLVVGGFLLSIWQLGYERRNHVSELTFALPYPRWLLYTTKWMVGFTYIAFTVTFTIALDFTVLKLSEVGDYIQIGSFMSRGFHMMFVIASTYIFSMFIGSFTGSWTMQAALSIISLFLFEFFTLMMEQFLFIFKITPTYTYIRTRGTVWDSFNISNWVFHERWDYSYIMIGIISTFLLFISTLFYSRNRLENNGKLIIFPSVEKALIICFVLCTVLLGGRMGYDVILSGRIGYLVGAGIGAVLGYLIIRTLTHMRIRL